MGVTRADLERLEQEQQAIMRRSGCQIGDRRLREDLSPELQVTFTNFPPGVITSGWAFVERYLHNSGEKVL